jgi:hypothetical protein
MSTADDIKRLADRLIRKSCHAERVKTAPRDVWDAAFAEEREAFADLHAAIDTLAGQRDALREALTECANYIDCIPESAAGGDDDAIRLARIARAAIKASEGKAA